MGSTDPVQAEGRDYEEVTAQPWASSSTPPCG